MTKLTQTAPTSLLTRPFVMLTQDDCPQCERLKLMLEKPLRGAFDGSIQVVHRQQHPEEFAELTGRYHVRSTPSLIRCTDGQLLSDTSGLGAVKAFLTAP